jgi:T4 RnlA family RNA ligase
MPDSHIQLYDNMMNLINSAGDKAFFYKDFPCLRQTDCNTVYRIFNYRLASYTDFLLPDALEARGIMFEVSDESENAEMIRLACRPLIKFFNYRENPLTMDIDVSNPKQIMVKEDGSLISTFDHYGQLRFKTRGSINSDQVNQVSTFLYQNRDDDNVIQLITELTDLTKQGYTVNMEWTSPLNRIVLNYSNSNLVVLSVRSVVDGNLIPKEELTTYSEICNKWVKTVDVENGEHFIDQIPLMQDIEGFVIELHSGQMIKVKTEWYLTLHHTKDSVTNPRRLYEAVLEEATDDLRSLFYDDPIAMKLINDMETFVITIYNDIVDRVEKFYERNKHLTRKDYAILGQEEFAGDKGLFGLCMEKYIGRPVDFKAFMKKNWKTFGLSDDHKEVE